MISRRFFSLAVVVAILGLGSSSSQGAIIIDNFDNTTHGVNLTFPIVDGYSGTDLAGPIPTSDTIGGYRFLQLDITSTPSQFAGASLIVDSAAPGQLLLASAPDVISEAMVQWDANGAGLGGVDLTDGGGLTNLLVRVLSQDLDGTLTFEIDTNSGLLTGMTPAALGDNYIAFDDLVGPGDITAVNSVKLFITGTAALDMRLDLIAATNVPEPIGLSVWAVMLGAGVVYRRRLKKA